MKERTLKIIIKAFEQEIEKLLSLEEKNQNLWKLYYDLKKENEMLRADLKELSDTTFKK